MITKSSYNEACGDNEDNIMLFCDNNIFASYSCIKFITLFKYLILYHISNFDL